MRYQFSTEPNFISTENLGCIRLGLKPLQRTISHSWHPLHIKACGRRCCHGRKVRLGTHQICLNWWGACPVKAVPSGASWELLATSRNPLLLWMTGTNSRRLILGMNCCQMWWMKAPRSSRPSQTIYRSVPCQHTSCRRTWAMLITKWCVPPRHTCYWDMLVICYWWPSCTHSLQEC